MADNQDPIKINEYKSDGFSLFHGTMNISQPTHEQLEMTRGAGFVFTFFGIVFFLFGFGFIVDALASFEIRHFFVFALPFGLSFGLMGLGCATFRVRKSFNKSTDTYESWWRIFIWFRTSCHPLSTFKYLTITKETRGTSDTAKYTVFPLKISDGNTSETVDEPRDPTTALLLSEHIADFLHLETYDSTDGAKVNT